MLGLLLIEETEGEALLGLCGDHIQVHFGYFRWIVESSLLG